MSLAEACRALLGARPGLRPLPLAPALVRRDGTFRDAPVELAAEAWTGGGVAYARVVTIAGPELSIVNVLGVPDAGQRAPGTILGIDLVSVAGAPTVVVADLSPLEPARASPAVAGAQATVLRARGPFPPAGALPGWCGRWFSPHHLFTRVPAGDAARAAAAAIDFAGLWLETTPATGDAAAPQLPPAAAAYCDDHRQQDPGLRLLDRLFDPDWAEAFRARVLFPSRLPTSTIKDPP